MTISGRGSSRLAGRIEFSDLATNPDTLCGRLSLSCALARFTCPDTVPAWREASPTTKQQRKAVSMHRRVDNGGLPIE